MKYNDLSPKNYINTNPVGKVGNTDIYLQDIGIAALLAGLPQHYRGIQSSGKTQLMRDFRNSYFEGKKYALLEEGRSDYRPKDLFQKLNISLAKGNADSLPEIKAVYSSDNGLEYLIRSYKEDNSGDFKLTWRKISKEERDRVIADFSITTSDIVELRRLGIKAYFIDEFNRCPEIVMNLFYGLMHGEVLHDGDVIDLGNGYYTGIAASNPEDFEGTFKMDSAMWSRFRVVLDFSAYETRAADDRELIERKEKPGIVKSELRDLTDYLEKSSEEIKETGLSAREKVMLEYFKKGMNLCTKSELGGKKGISKDHIRWPIDCKECPKMSTLCGIYKGLDQRSVDAVKFLARGIEKVASLKGAKDIDSINSFVLAYKFVVPYKGKINPKLVKEKKGIEALVLDQHTDAIVQLFSEKFRDIREVVKSELTFVNPEYSLPQLKKEFAQKGLEENYENIHASVRKKFEKEKFMTKQEFKESFSEKIEGLYSQAVVDIVQENGLLQYEGFFGDYLKKNMVGVYDKIQDSIIKPRQTSKRQYNKKLSGKNNDMPYSKFIENLNNELSGFFSTLLEMDGMPQSIYDSIPEVKSEADKKIDSFISNKIKSSPVRFVLEKDKRQLENELKMKLNKELAAMLNKDFSDKKKRLFQGEWSFLKEFYNDFLEEAKDE